MQTSFIPKKPITVDQDSGGGVSLFLLIAIIIFIVMIALGGGVWVWKNSLINKIQQAKIDLSEAKASYEEGTINSLIRLDDRMTVSEELLNKHLAISPLFLLLEKNTLKNVRIKSLKFSYGAENKIKMDLSGVAQSYGAISNLSYEVLSKQSDAFGANHLREEISQPMITDFSPNVDGSVAFNFSALINPKLISYSRTIDVANNNDSVN